MAGEGFAGGPVVCEGKGVKGEGKGREESGGEWRRGGEKEKERRKVKV